MRGSPDVGAPTSSSSGTWCARAIGSSSGGIGHQVAADATGRTAAAGMWVAGNAADVTAGVMQAAASGVTAAAAINADLTAEDTTAAVAARRARLSIEV